MKKSTILSVIAFLILGLAGASAAQSESPRQPADTAASEAPHASDTAAVETPPEPDTTTRASDTTGLPLDLSQLERSAPPTPQIPAETLEPFSLLDSLDHYFSRRSRITDIRFRDLYPRNTAEYLKEEAGYYQITYHETPVRTTVRPFGLVDDNLDVYLGDNHLFPYDRVIPADRLLDFDDLPTGAVESFSLIEGPLAGLYPRSYGLSMLRLHPQPTMLDTAEANLLVERGTFGYANTRARFSRAFSSRLGIAFSTDFRKGDGAFGNMPDDAYYLTGRVQAVPFTRTELDVSLYIYRRNGTWPVMPDSGGSFFNRHRTDKQLNARLTRHNFAGGALTGTFVYTTSRTQYDNLVNIFYRKIKPQTYTGQIDWTTSAGGNIFRLAGYGGHEDYEINNDIFQRDWGAVQMSAIVGSGAWRLFFFGRAKSGEEENLAYEGAAGLSGALSERWKLLLSAGYLTVWPDLADRHAQPIVDVIGAGPLEGEYRERGNPDLDEEKKLTGNAALVFQSSRTHLSASLNAGRIDDAIYYDRRFSEYPSGDVFPDNDRVHFADLNLQFAIDTLGPFYAVLSGSARRVESDRYGNRPPYSPRWQAYGRLGVRVYFQRVKVHVRAWTDGTFFDEPLSYKLEPTGDKPILSWGVEASLKTLSVYYRMHNWPGYDIRQPAAFGIGGWYYSWGFQWKFFN